MVTQNAINTGKPIEVSNGGTGVASFNAYGPVVAASTSTGNLTSVTPSATSGATFISQGSAANPAFGTAVVQGGGTGATSFTSYSLITGGTTSTGVFQSVGNGTSGQFLTSAGAAALPTWATSTGEGVLVLLSSQTASNSASINFTSLITSTYKIYYLSMSNYNPVTTTQGLNLLVSTDNGSTYLATGYTSSTKLINYNSTTWNNSDFTTLFRALNGSSSTANGPGGSGNAWLYNVGNGNQFGIITNNVAYNSTTGIERYGSGMGYNTATTVNAFQLIAGAGNINNGTFTLYGLLET